MFYPPRRAETDRLTFPTDIEALKLVDQAYQDRTEWIKKSIRTTAKVSTMHDCLRILLSLCLP